MIIIIAIRALPAIFSISEILMENMPRGIDSQKLMNEIIKDIPNIQHMHSLHVWRFLHENMSVSYKMIVMFFSLSSSCVLMNFQSYSQGNLRNISSDMS
jgi:Co/Zn/Cd efflux system component